MPIHLGCLAAKIYDRGKVPHFQIFKINTTLTK